MTPRVRILACGSEEGGDDAAALLAVRRLGGAARDGASVEEVGQLSAEQLLDDAPGVVRVVVDCVRGVEPGRLVDLPLAELPRLAARLGIASSHALGPGQAVALAGRLGGLRAGDRFVGIGGADYRLGGGLSPAVAAGLPRLTRRLARMIA